MEIVRLKTRDGVHIVADYYDQGDTAVILLHQNGKDRHSWTSLIPELMDGGYSVLALDFRGHGESDLEFDALTDKDYFAMRYDLEAAELFLKGKKIIVIGASIGANAVLTSKNSIAGVLLSPGLNYRSLNAEKDILTYKHPLLIIASQEDGDSYISAKKLQESHKNAMLKTYSGMGHGTMMFTKSPDLPETILEWLDITLKRKKV